MIRSARAVVAGIALSVSITACSGGNGDVKPDRSVTNTPAPAGAFAAHARASVVSTTGHVAGFTELRLSGAFLLAAGTQTADGKAHRLLVDGGNLTLRGNDLGVLARALTITAASIEAVADVVPTKAKRASADRASLAPRVEFANDVVVEGTRVTIDGEAAAGPQALHIPSGRASLYGRALVRPLPPTFRIGEDGTGRAPRAGFATPTYFSWRGTGSLSLAGRRFTAPVALLAKTLNVTATRRGGGLDLDMQGVATQIAVGGKLQLRTTLEAKVTTPDRALYPGISEQLTWVMETTGPWEAIITGVRAVNAAARWARLHVDDPPPLDALGAVAFATAPLRCVGKASAFAEFSLCAQIAPEEGAEAPVVFHVPFFQHVGRYDAVFEITGNFPTVRVSVPMDVKPR